MITKHYRSLKEFYPFYLSQHTNTTSRILHFIGSGLVVLCFFTGFLFHDFRFFIVTPVVGYGFAWIGHYFFEKNKPATFKYPAYSLASDFILFYDLLTGKQSFKVK
ncbi:hypothetical protein ACVWYG_000131 [Pedobacter sp. UYEF25]